MPAMDPDGPIKTTTHPVLDPEMQPSTVEKPLTDKQQHALDLANLRRHGRSGGEFAVDPDTLHGRRAVDNAVILTYTANRAYAQVLGDDSFKPHGQAEAWQLDSNRAGVLKLLDNPSITPEASHLSWMLDKLAAGWTRGEVKDAEKKTHPCMVHYSELPVQQRVKDHVFLSTARAVLRTYGTRTAWWKPRTSESIKYKFGCTDPAFDYGMLVAQGRANRIVAGALGGLYRGFGRTMLSDMASITDELDYQVACCMMAATPELAYSAYRANKWPVELPEFGPGYDTSSDAFYLRRAHWFIANMVARTVMEIEGVELKPPRRQNSWWRGRADGTEDMISVEVHGEIAMPQPPGDDHAHEAMERAIGGLKP